MNSKALIATPPKNRGRQVDYTRTQLDQNTALINMFLMDCKANNLSRNTIRGYSENMKLLRRVAEGLSKSILSLTPDDFRAFKFTMLSRITPAGKKMSAFTVNSRLRTFSAFYSFCVRQKLIESNPIADVPRCRVKRNLKVVIDPAKFGRAIQSLDENTFYGARAIAMLALNWDTMIRLSELTGLRLDNIQLKPNRTIKILAKGRRERILPFSKEAADRIEHYLDNHRHKYPGPFLFCTKEGRPIEKRNLYRTYEKAGKAVGIKIAPHLVRHSAATHYLRLTGDVHKVSAILGHANIKTTMLYLHTDDSDVLSSYDVVSPLNGVFPLDDTDNWDTARHLVGGHV